MSRPDTPGYLVAADRQWAWGRTPEKALAALVRRTKNVHRRIMVALPKGALNPWMDQMGNVRWDWAEGADRTGTTTVVAKFTTVH